MDSSTNKLKVRKDVKSITYHRSPTVAEVKFGYGAIHYRDFGIEECLKKDGTIKKVIRSKDDGLKYYY